MVSLWSVVEALIIPPAVGLVLAWMWYQWRNRRMISAASNIPSVLPRLPLIGHIHYFLFFRLFEKGKNSVSALLNGRKDLGMSSMWIGPVPCVVIHRPDLIHKFLKNSQILDKASEYKYFDVFMRNGLLTAPGHVWKKTRRPIGQVFTPRNVSHYVRSFNAKSERLVERLAQLVDAGQTNVAHFVSIFATENILSLLFGDDFHSEPESEIFKIIMELIEKTPAVMSKRVYFLWLRWDVLFKFLHRTLFEKRDIIWKTFFSVELTKAMEKGKHFKKMDEDSEGISSKEAMAHRPVTLVDSLVALRELDSMFDDDYRLAEFITLTGTGTDTIAATLGSLLVVLGSHPHIQEKLYKEVVEVAGVSSEIVSEEDINKMTYMDRVLKETMRRFWVVPVIGRQCTEDVTLDGYTIASGTTVIVSIRGLHANPDVFPDPYTFDPDRFTQENIAQRQKYSFLPFSYGPRVCVGGHYAMVSMKIVLTHILRAYEVHSDVVINKMRFMFIISLVSSDGYHVSFKKRSPLKV